MFYVLMNQALTPHSLFDSGEDAHVFEDSFSEVLAEAFNRIESDSPYSILTIYEVKIVAKVYRRAVGRKVDPKTGERGDNTLHGSGIVEEEQYKPFYVIAQEMDEGFIDILSERFRVEGRYDSLTDAATGGMTFLNLAAEEKHVYVTHIEPKITLEKEVVVHYFDEEKKEKSKPNKVARKKRAVGKKKARK